MTGAADDVFAAAVVDAITAAGVDELDGGGGSEQS